jgi:hypothetical protein
VVVADCVGVQWVGVDLSKFCVLLGEQIQSEVVLLCGSVRDTIGRKVLDECLFNDSRNWRLFVTNLETEESCGSADVHVLI